jgi:septal ring factor EnvC (AmiA/AmiB activator)
MKDEKQKEDKGSLDLDFVISEHKKELWAFKMKEAEWVKTANQLEGTKRIVEELSKKLQELRAQVKNLEEIEEGHRKTNGELSVSLTQLKKDNDELRKDNKILANEVSNKTGLCR